MPARIGPLCAAAALQPPPPLFLLLPSRYHVLIPHAHRRCFHSTPTRRDEIDDKNHYEILNIQTNASSADIKKSFYTLSKTYHPDHNHADPHAPRRFMRISEAYSTLSNVDKRAQYDRDVLRLHDHGHGQQQQHRPSGSYHSSSSSSSSGPAGGRPASGLSRRRGTFRGPPPSFYRAGGWGAHAAKRSAAHEGSTGTGAGAQHSPFGGGSESAERSNSSSGYTSYNAGGMGPGQEPFGRGAAGYEVPHFDRTAQAAHTRTQERIKEQLAQRQRSHGPSPVSSDGDMSDLGKALLLLGLLLGAAGLVPLFLPTGMGASEKKRRW